MKLYSRRKFLKSATIGGIAVSLAGVMPATAMGTIGKGKRIGIIGLDVSHSLAFTKLLNAAGAGTEFSAYRVVAAYAGGSKDIKASISRVAEFSTAVAALGVQIVSSVADMLAMVDVVMVNTNDGRLHYEQVLQVLKTGKPAFIDKPLAASLPDVLAIFEASERYKVPVFSSSSMRYFENEEALSKDKIGKVLGASSFSPATLEKSHSDLFWYGIHGVEILYRLMGKGCLQVSGVFSPDTDVVTGSWADGRLATFRGTRSGTHSYGATVFAEKGTISIEPARGFKVLLQQIINFYEQRVSPVDPAETIEIYTFMEAAAVSKRKGGASVLLKDVLSNATQVNKHRASYHD